MNITNKHYKIYKMLALAFVVVLTLGVTMIAINSSVSASNGAGICSNDKTITCSVNADCGAGNTCYIPTAGGQVLSNQVCMQQAAGFGLQCTANDVSLALTSGLQVVDKDPNTTGVQGCLFPGDTATISFVGQFQVTDKERYDVGVWIAQDGGDAYTGKCAVANFPISPTPPGPTWMLTLSRPIPVVTS
jgi:hypothetical protein